MKKQHVLVVAVGFLIASFGVLTGCDDVESACESQCEQFVECELEEDIDSCIDDCTTEFGNLAEEGGDACESAAIDFSSCMSGLSCDELGEAMFGGEECADEMEAMEEECDA